MLTDATSIALSLVAIRLAQRGRHGRPGRGADRDRREHRRDLIAFIVTAIAGAVILITGFRRADGIASLAVAAVMLRAAKASCASPKMTA
jgi:Co/Zn/Cd efflux system component